MGGLRASLSKEADELWKDLEPLLMRSEIDYTIFWRQLAAVLQVQENADDDVIVGPLLEAFYSGLSESLKYDWAVWLRKWSTLAMAEEQGTEGKDRVVARMRGVNPKYILREWMLVQAYEEALQGNFDLVHELYELILKPYDEQPKFEARYYRRATADWLQRPGCAYMS